MSTPAPWISIEQICIQRKRRALVNVPPPRLELQKSPYPQYTQRQLDMRRKCEILQHKSNTQTNQLTKAQKYAQIVTGNVGSVNRRSLQCAEDLYQPTPTWRSDVPGPVIMLQLNPNVPLYNYVVDQNAYGIINSPLANFWFTIPVLDQLILSRDITELFALYLQNSLSQNYYVYTFQTPISLQITGGGIIDGDTLVIPSNGELTVNMGLANTIYIYVYFNSTLVHSNDPNTTPLQGSNMQVEYVAGEQTMMKLDVPIIGSYPYVNPFSAVQYAGYVKVSNLSLFTQPGFIYDIKLSFNGLTVNPPLFTNINYELSVLTNVTDVNTVQNGCTVTSSPSTVPNTGFIFSVQ